MNYSESQLGNLLYEYTNGEGASAASRSRFMISPRVFCLVINLSKKASPPFV